MFSTGYGLGVIVQKVNFLYQSHIIWNGKIKRNCNSLDQSIHVCNQDDLNRFWASFHWSYGVFLLSIPLNFTKRHINSLCQSIHFCNQDNFNRLRASVHCSGKFLVSIRQNLKWKKRGIAIYWTHRYISAINKRLRGYWPRVIIYMVNFSSRFDRFSKWKNEKDNTIH